MGPILSAIPVESLTFPWLATATTSLWEENRRELMAPALPHPHLQAWFRWSTPGEKAPANQLSDSSIQPSTQHHRQEHSMTSRRGTTSAEASTALYVILPATLRLIVVVVGRRRRVGMQPRGLVVLTSRHSRTFSPTRRRGSSRLSFELYRCNQGQEALSPLINLVFFVYFPTPVPIQIFWVLPRCGNDDPWFNSDSAFCDI